MMRACTYAFWEWDVIIYRPLSLSYGIKDWTSPKEKNQNTNRATEAGAKKRRNRGTCK